MYNTWFAKKLCRLDKILKDSKRTRDNDYISFSELLYDLFYNHKPNTQNYVSDYIIVDIYILYNVYSFHIKDLGTHVVQDDHSFLLICASQEIVLFLIFTTNDNIHNTSVSSCKSPKK